MSPNLQGSLFIHRKRSYSPIYYYYYTCWCVWAWLHASATAGTLLQRGNRESDWWLCWTGLFCQDTWLYPPPPHHGHEAGRLTDSSTAYRALSGPNLRADLDLSSDLGSALTCSNSDQQEEDTMNLLLGEHTGDKVQERLQGICCPPIIQQL